MGLFDLTNYAPGASYLTPEQRQQASTMGWLNTASSLANASAPHAGGAAPSVMQLLTGGVQGFSQGANQYTDLLAQQYKQMSEMQRSQKMDEYLANNSETIQKQYNLPAGMPVSPKMISEIAEKSGIRNAENVSDLTYKPAIAGATKGAELPYAMQQDANKAALDWGNKSQELNLSNFFANQKPREVAPGASLVAPDGNGAFSTVFTAPQDPLTVAKTKEAEQKIIDAEKAKQDTAISLAKTIRNGEELFASPKRRAGTGFSSINSYIPATDARDFSANLESFKSQNFLPAVQQLKGMGALSDAEGQKLTAAVGALDAGMSEKAFKTSLNQINQDLKDAYERATGTKYTPKTQTQSNGWAAERVN